MQKKNAMGTFGRLVAIAALSLGSIGIAAAVDTADLEKRFAAADKDADGKLTKAEADAGMPRVAKNFDRLDKDKKGYVTLDQLKAAADH